MICPRKAQTDITCYKVFYHEPGTGIMYTPFQKMPVIYLKSYSGTEMGSIQAAGKIMKFPGEIFREGDCYLIHGGMIHAFTETEFRCCKKNPGQYKCIMRAMGLAPFGSVPLVYKCIIPKGTLYYKSADGLEICAREIRLCEDITQELLTNKTLSK